MAMTAVPRRTQCTHVKRIPNKHALHVSVQYPGSASAYTVSRDDYNIAESSCLKLMTYTVTAEDVKPYLLQWKTMLRTEGL